MNDDIPDDKSLPIPPGTKLTYLSAEDISNNLGGPIYEPELERLPPDVRRAIITAVDILHHLDGFRMDKNFVEAMADGRFKNFRVEQLPELAASVHHGTVALAWALLRKRLKGMLS